MLDRKQYHNGRLPSNGHQSNTASLDSGMESGEDELNLRQLFHAMWRRKWFILSSIVLLGVVGGIMAFTTTPIYKSDGSILIYQPQNELSTLGLGGGGALGSALSSNYNIGGGTTVGNELQVLRSRQLSLKIADSLLKKRLLPSGRQYPIIFRNYPDDSTVTSADTVAIRLRNRLTFYKVDGNADVIAINYESPSPEASGRVVNIALSEFKQLSTRHSHTSANSAASFLNEERSRIKDSLDIAEENLRVFMNKHKLVQIDAQTQELVQHMADLEATRQEARAKLEAANSGVEQYKNELNGIKPGLAEQYSEAVGPDITKLQYAKSELEVKKQQLLANNPGLKESSPQIAGLNQQIASYKKRIKSLTQNLLNRGDQYLGFLGGGEGVAQNVSDINEKLIELQVEQKQYQAQVKVISSQLNEQEKFFNNLPDNIIAFAKLKRDVKINEELYETVTKQYAETSIQERSQFGLGRVIDKGYTPKEPDAPNKPLYILVGLILGGILSAGYVFINVAFFTTIKGADKMRNLRVPLLAVIPAMDEYITERYNEVSTVDVKGKAISTDLVTFLNPESPISESFRRLENSLVYAHSDIQARSIVITSTAQGEGKSTTIANLGVILAEGGHNTLIVDADFRRPKLHHIFGLPQSLGITEVLSGKSRFEDIIQQTCAPGLSLITTGERPANAAATTRSKDFLALLEKLKNRFDFVLIDTAPFGSVTDSAPLLKITDGTIVIAKFGTTNEVELEQTVQNLHHLETNILGTVLTAYDYTKSNDVHAASRYYKGYYQQSDA